MKRSALPLLCFILGVVCISPAHAQFSSDYETNLISGVVSNWSGDYTVGGNTVFDALRIEDGGFLINTFGYVGKQSVASNNAAIVDGGSVWSNTSELFVGYDGAGNSLTIANNSKVFSVFGAIGNTSSNNRVLVTDSGSAWNNPYDLFVGNGGSGNSLTISNGGAVFDVNCWVGNSPSSSNNIVFVTGVGSVLSNSGDMYFGDRGRGDVLTITNAGKVFNRYGQVGFSGSNNSVLITGSDSIWNNEILFVGYNGSSNQVTIADGATIHTVTASISINSKASGNVIKVLGGSLLITNSTQDAALVVGPAGQGTLEFNGGTIIADQLIVTNNFVGITNSTFNFNYGTLTTAGAKLSFNGQGSWPMGRTSGKTAVWNIVGGTNVSFVTLSGFTSIGDTVGATGIVTVTGADTLWTNYSGIAVGGGGGGHGLLIISNGAHVVSGYGSVAYGTDSEFLVTGTGSRWDNSGSFWIGSAQIVVNKGATLTSNGGYIESGLGVVDGLNSRWSCGANLTIGYQYSYGQFVITNGGTVVDSTGSIGDLNGGSDSHDNSVLVTGSGSVWSNVVLYVGNYGSHNRLRIEDGGKVVSPYGYIGYGNHANQAIVTGNGSAWDIGQRLNIGDGGTSNELYVTSYGRVAVDGPVQFAWSDYAGRIVVSNSSTLTCRSLQIGSYSPYATGTLTVEGGVFAATNQTANGLTWIRRGGVIINSGTALFDIVAVTNGSWCVLKFNGGFIDAKATIVSNSLQFAVGDGNHSATFHLSGGTHNFANGIAISTNALLTGCGTIVGTVVNRGRIAISCPGGALSFGGALTNDGTIIAHDVATLDFFGPVVNNGVIDTFGGSAYFHAGFINNGTIVDASSFRITTIAQEGADIRVTWTTVGGTTNFVQATEDPCSNFDDISSVIVASGTGLTSTDYLDAGAATNFPSRFYRIRIVP